MTLRRGFSLDEGEPVVVVEDVITTGGSTREVMDAVARARRAGRWRWAASWTAAAGRRTSACRARACSSSRCRRYAADACPLCAAGSKPEKPGSRAGAERRGLTCPSTASRSPTTAPTSSAGSASAPGAGRTVQGVLEEALGRLAGGARVAVAGAGPHRRRRARPRAGGLVRAAARARAGRAAARAQRPAARGRARPRRGAGARGLPRRGGAPSPSSTATSSTAGASCLPQRRRFAGFVPWTLDEAAVRAAAALYLGRHDFASLASAGGSVKTTVAHGDALGGRVRRARRSSTRSRPTASCARWSAAWWAG